ncbi:chitin synthase chs-2-like isoform X2 [Photinus pyralis]|uniref:chitin synthase chs-2-like isoform X2 n=1 Tax=Photinus pyralis TaxID=7054 RepID=UPI0012671FCB|nr:chitin synthase chs-2-like isoform X2 [Photinus pyralis]
MLGNNTNESQKYSYLPNSPPAEPKRRRWDAFNDPPVEVLQGSAEETKISDGLVKVAKIAAYLVTFIVVLGAATISKGTLLFMTSQIGQNTTKMYCNELIDRNRQFVVQLPQIERTVWMWMLIFAYFVPELLTFLRSLRMSIFKRWDMPTSAESWSLVATESLPPIGSALLVFVILPELDVLKGVMLTNAICFVPAVVAFFSRTPHEKSNVVKISFDVISIIAQGSALVIWPMIEKEPTMWMIPITVLLISAGWWENFVSEGSPIKFIKKLGKSKKKFNNSRYFLYSFISIWKCILFFVTTIAIISVREGSVDFMFENFADAFSSHAINATEIKPLIGGEGGMFETANHSPIMSNSLTPIWVFLINATSTYICYIFGKFACKILIQGFSFAFPVNLTVPTTVAILVALCGVHNGNPCAFSTAIPPYLFFSSPPFYFLENFIRSQHVWVWLLWLLSQIWITIHIWQPRCEKLAKTERLYVRPMFDAFLIDQSLALNRRRDDLPEKLDENDGDEGETFVNTPPMRNNSSYDCSVTRIYACGTMWHEKFEEMVEFLKSVIRLDEDQRARRLVRDELGFEMPDYYELETHIYFDDAFVRLHEKDNNPKLNQYVKNLVLAVDEATSKVHQIANMKLGDPTKYVTPYGGRLVWTLPGKTLLIAHLKDSKKIRQKKRWSQVMYMYYLLGHRLMQRNDLSPKQKDLISENTYILALDGDIDFQPHAVHLLVDLMKKAKDLGAACGRIHPLGYGPLVWYQMFEYAIGHWLQKAAEHTIGCVLCSPGCFSLFRAKALMENGVMRRYASQAKLARHFVQYDLGEDRWLCTLLLQNGYRVEYSAASDSYTHCPEGFKEFYNQRRRWMPSTTANVIDLLMNCERTIKINDSISRPYITYQVRNQLRVQPFHLIFSDNTTYRHSFRPRHYIFNVSWRICNSISNWSMDQLFMERNSHFNLCCRLHALQSRCSVLAGIISAIYGLVMMAVLIGVLLQINADGPLAPSSLFFFCVAGELILTAFLHPKEWTCLRYGLVYYVTVPSMYMLLVIYSIFNLNNISWGTRELTVVPETVPETKTEPKSKGRRFSFISGEKQEDAGAFELSIGGVFRCLFCTHSKKDEDNAKLTEISESLKALTAKLDALEVTLQKMDEDQEIQPSVPELSSPSPEKDNTMVADLDVEETEDHQWLEQDGLGHGDCAPLEPRERMFFQELISKYLYRIKENKAQLDKDLTDLRDKTVMAFFMVNALFVLVVFLLTLKKDFLHVNWPLGAKYNFTYNGDRRDIQLSKTPLQLEPIGFVFLAFFASLLVVQFIAMLFHRFSTFAQILSNTHISWRACTKIDTNNLTADEILARNPVKVVKWFMKINGADDDEEDERETEVAGRRKTVQQLAEQPTQKQLVADFFDAFELRKNRYLKSTNPQGAARKSLADAILRRQSKMRGRQSTMNGQIQLEGGYTNEGFLA